MLWGITQFKFLIYRQYWFDFLICNALNILNMSRYLFGNTRPLIFRIKLFLLFFPTDLRSFNFVYLNDLVLICLSVLSFIIQAINFDKLAHLFQYIQVFWILFISTLPVRYNSFYSFNSVYSYSFNFTYSYCFNSRYFHTFNSIYFYSFNSICFRKLNLIYLGFLSSIYLSTLITSCIRYIQ